MDHRGILTRAVLRNCCSGFTQSTEPMGIDRIACSNDGLRPLTIIEGNIVSCEPESPGREHLLVKCTGCKPRARRPQRAFFALVDSHGNVKRVSEETTRRDFTKTRIVQF